RRNPANSDEAETGTHADVKIPPFLNRKRASGCPNPRKWFDTWGWCPNPIQYIFSSTPRGYGSLNRPPCLCP
ncbi:hypothetical protein A2U01_0092907, partial [Trifolium medium]|nr:hypothetical protein [Trifolium medium]